MRFMRKKILFFFCFLFAFHAYSQNWDINTLKKINGWDDPFIRNTSKTISNSVYYISIGLPATMAICAIIEKNESLLKDAVYIGTTVGGTVVFTYVMKLATNRKRPYERYPDVLNPTNRPSSSSFPSAHTAAAFSLATSLSLKYPKWYIIAPSALWATSVGFARMNEGVHYPSDVLAGAVIGAGCAVVNVYVNKWLNSWLFPAKKKHTPFSY